MDLLEIRKKAKKKAGTQEVPAAAQAVAPPPPAVNPPAPAAAPAPVAVTPPPAAPRAAEPEITAESFERFLQSSPSPKVAPAEQPSKDLNLPSLAKSFGHEPETAGQPKQGLDSLFLDLATEELYRHSYLTDEMMTEVEQREVLSCMLANEQYGIDIHRIKEIIKVREITEVPRTPRFILGIITLRGRVIPVFDLRERLSLAKSDLGRESKIVVVHHNQEFYGLIVDAVIDVSRFPANSVEATPPVMVGVEAKYIEGIGRTGDQMIILLNLNEVLNLEAAAAA